MLNISATEAKNHLAGVMENALKEPVVIEKNGRPYVVMMSVAEFEKSASRRHKESFLRLCHELGKRAEKRGMTPKILQSILRDA